MDEQKFVSLKCVNCRRPLSADVTDGRINVTCPKCGLTHWGSSEKLAGHLHSINIEARADVVRELTIVYG